MSKDMAISWQLSQDEAEYLLKMLENLSCNPADWVAPQLVNELRAMLGKWHYDRRGLISPGTD